MFGVFTDLIIKIVVGYFFRQSPSYFSTNPSNQKVCQSIWSLICIKYDAYLTWTNLQFSLLLLWNKKAHLMRRNWSCYIEALFNVRHANVDIEVSERITCKSLSQEAATCSSEGHLCQKIVDDERSCDLLEVPHRICVTCDLLVCFHDFLNL